MTVEDAADRPDAQALSTRAAQGGRWVAAGALSSNLVAAAVLLVLAAALPPRDLGILALGQLVFVVANALQDLGLFDVVVHRRDRAQEAAELVALCWLVTSAVLGAGVVAGSSTLAAFFGEPRAGTVIAVFGGLLFCYAAASVPLALRTRALDLRLRSQVQLAAVVVGGATTCVLVALGQGITAMLVGQVVQALLLLVLAWTVGPRLVPRWHPGLLPELLRYGRGSFGTAAFTIAQYNVDYAVVGRVLGAAALGLYAFAFRVAFLPYTVVTRVVTSTMFALVCRLEPGRDQGEAVARYTRATLLLVSPLAAGLALFAPALVLLGEEWRDAVVVARVLAPYVVLASLASIAEVALKAVGRPGRAAASAGTHLVLLTGLLVLLAELGLTAVGVVRTVAAGAALLVGWACLLRATELSVGQLLRSAWLPLAGTAAMAVVAIATGVAGDPDPRWVSVVPAAVASLAAYGALVVVADSGLRARAVGALGRGTAP